GVAGGAALVVLVVRTLQGLADEVVDDGLLLLREGVEDLLNGLVVGLVVSLVFGRGLAHGFSCVVSMCQLDGALETRVDDRLILERLADVSVLNIDVVDEGARIRSRENEADLLDVTVQNVLALLGEVV